MATITQNQNSTYTVTVNCDEVALLEEALRLLRERLVDHEQSNRKWRQLLQDMHMIVRKGVKWAI